MYQQCTTTNRSFRRLLIPSVCIAIGLAITLGSVQLLTTKIKRKLAGTDTPTSNAMDLLAKSSGGVVPNPGPQSSEKRSESAEEIYSNDARPSSLLERTAEEYRRKLAKLRDAFESQAIDAVAKFDGLIKPFREYAVRKEVFEYQLEVRRNNPILELPLNNPPEPIDRAGLLAQFRQIAGDFEKQMQMYEKSCLSEQFQFFKETSSIPRVGNDQRNFLLEAIDSESIQTAVFMVHARPAIERALRTGEGDLAPYLADVPPMFFSQRIQFILNQHRKNGNLALCQLDRLLASAAQEHATSMANQDAISANTTLNGLSVLDRIEQKGGSYEGVSSHALSSGSSPSDVESVVDFLLNREKDREHILSDKKCLGVGVSKSKSGKWYISILLGQYGK